MLPVSEGRDASAATSRYDRFLRTAAGHGPELAE
jgi:hypothetical protein